MMFQAIRILCFIALFSCVNDDFDNTSPKETLSAACALCRKPVEEMQWLKTLLEQSETNVSLRGDIYAVSIDGSIIFVHQPMIMSCLACVLYDCEGNKISPATVDHEKLRDGMKAENRIFRSY